MHVQAIGNDGARLLRRFAGAAIIACGLGGAPALAGEAKVAGVAAQKNGGSWRFDVTVRHADEGWEHYADAWRVVGPGGTVLGTRTLHHPHVDEQPFTRSLSGIAIPPGVDRVTVEAHDSVHGWGPGVPVDLPR